MSHGNAVEEGGWDRSDGEGGDRLRSGLLSKRGTWAPRTLDVEHEHKAALKRNGSLTPTSQATQGEGRGLSHTSPVDEGLVRRGSQILGLDRYRETMETVYQAA